MNRRLVVGLSVLVGCGSSTPAPNTPEAATERATTAPVTNAVAATTRIASVNFGGLVRGAQALTDPTTHAELGCVLGAEGDGFALGTAPVSALGTLPDAPMHLAETLGATAMHARVLTRWGQRGGEPSDLLVATMTPLPPHAAVDPMVVMALTRSGVFLRETDAPSTTTTALSRDDAMVWLLARTARGPVTVIVTAEAETATTEVHALLHALPSSVRHVALAVALAANTRLPSNAPQAPDARVHCPDGLPEPTQDAPEGDLPSASIMRSLTFIHEPLQRCLANTNGPGAVGGKVTLAIRIADTGNVSDTCLVEDAIHDNVLAACITETARSATFSRPHPVGFVDVHVPLSLSPVFDAPPRAVCE